MLRYVLVTLLLCGCSRSGDQLPASPAPPDLQTANASRPGERVELEKVLVPGKSTVVELYSDNCPPCRQMAPVVERIASAHPEVAFRKLNIDRSGMQQIDFDSPLAQQLQVHSVPAFRVYDDHGKLTAEGDEAKEQMRTWYNQAQTFDQARQSSEGRQLLKDYSSPTPQ